MLSLPEFSRNFSRNVIRFECCFCWINPPHTNDTVLSISSMSLQQPCSIWTLVQGFVCWTQSCKAAGSEWSCLTFMFVVYLCTNWWQVVDFHGHAREESQAGVNRLYFVSTLPRIELYSWFEVLLHGLSLHHLAVFLLYIIWLQKPDQCDV